MAHSPCLSHFPLLIPLAPLVPFSDPLPLSWNPPCCDRIRPPWSPIACELNPPFPCPCSLTPHSKIPTPRGFLTSKYTLIRTVSRTWLTRSSTGTPCNPPWNFSEVISNPWVNLWDGAGGYWQPSDKFATECQRVKATLGQFTRGSWATLQRKGVVNTLYPSAKEKWRPSRAVVIRWYWIPTCT